MNDSDDTPDSNCNHYHPGMDSLAAVDDVSHGGGSGDPPLSPMVVVIGTVACPALDHHIARADGCAAGTLLAVAQVERSEELGDRSPLLYNGDGCSDDVSLVGRRDEGDVVRGGSASPPSLPDFINSLRLPLQEPLIDSTPIRRICRRISLVVPRRSVRIAALTHLRDPRLEVQAKKVLLSKWRPAGEPPSPQIPNNSHSAKFHHRIREPLSSSKRSAM